MLFSIIDKSSYLLQELGRRECNTLRRSQALSLNPSPTTLDVQPLPSRIEPGPKGRRAGDRKSAGKKSKMAKEAMKADSRSSVATLKSQEVDVVEEMDTATPEDIEAGSRREEALEAITARNSKLYKSICSSSVCRCFNFLSGAFRSVSYSLSRSVFCNVVLVPTSVKSQARYLVFCWEAGSGSALKSKLWSFRSSQIRPERDMDAHNGGVEALN
jgi:hypothetical protein